MNITIIGYYGSNFGDLLMLKALVENLEKSSISILTYGSRTHLLEQPFIKEKSIEVIEVSTASKLEIFKTIKKSKAIIWGGGTCFMDEGGTGGIKYMLLGKLLGCRVYYAGIGADSHNRLSTKFCMLVATIVSNAIYARDHDSIKALTKINPFAAKKIIKTHDLAYASDIAISCENKSRDRYLVFCPRNLEQYKNLPYDTNRKLLEIARRAAEELGLRKIIVLNADPLVDQTASEQAANYFQSAGFANEIVSGDDLEKCSASLRNCEFLLTIRLHPAVIALENSIPFAIFNYSEKNRKFAEESDTLERLIHQEGIDNFRPLYTLAQRTHKRCVRTETIQTIKKLAPGSN